MEVETEGSRSPAGHTANPEHCTADSVSDQGRLALPAGDAMPSNGEGSASSSSVPPVVLAKECRPLIRRAVNSDVLLAGRARVFAVTDLQNQAVQRPSSRPTSSSQPSAVSGVARPRATASQPVSITVDDLVRWERASQRGGNLRCKLLVI